MGLTFFLFRLEGVKGGAECCFLSLGFAFPAGGELGPEELLASPIESRYPQPPQYAH